MPRKTNPLSKRNETRTFSLSGAELARLVEREAVKLGASKRARVVRERGEFDTARLSAALRAPHSAVTGTWSIEEIVAARTSQMLGKFMAPARLSEALGTDDAVFTARDVRLAPVQSLGVEILPAKGGKGDKIADEAVALFGVDGIAISSETVTTIRTHLADHGIAIGFNEWCARADGTRWDVVHRAWPIEHVFWDELTQQYMTKLDPRCSGDGPADRVPICHGDGRWVVYAKSELLPHRRDAALLPAAMVWARRAFAMRDWMKGSASHGNAKVVGEMPPETPLTDSDGELTAEGAAFLTLIQAIASQSDPVGIRPAGSKVDYITNSSKAWEVWKELTENAERAAARIYLGTDGVLGAQGGAPGVDISALFGVATSKIQSDLACIDRGARTGVISPWTAINFGDDKLAPMRRYTFPDPDESRVREDFAKRNAAFNADVAAYRTNGFVVDQALVDRVAALHGVPAPMLPAAPAAPAGAPAGAPAPTLSTPSPTP